MSKKKTLYNIKATVYDKRGRILSVGYNSYVKTHPLMKKLAKKVNLKHKECLHAEVAALIKCKGEPYKIFIERYDKKGNPKDAEPCPICKLAIEAAGVKLVEYTTGE